MSDGVVILADTYNLRNPIKKPIERWRYPGWKLNGFLFPIHAIGLSIAHPPVLFGIDPHVQLVLKNDSHYFFSCGFLQKVLLKQRIVTADHDSPVKSRNELQTRERINEHSGALRRPASGDAEQNASVLQIADCLHRLRREQLLL